jgi:hypothetical protein
MQQRPHTHTHYKIVRYKNVPSPILKYFILQRLKNRQDGYRCQYPKEKYSMTCMKCHISDAGVERLRAAYATEAFVLPCLEEVRQMPGVLNE